MALNDSCFDFLDSVAAAASTLAQDVHHYPAPNNPLLYGSEIEPAQLWRRLHMMQKRERACSVSIR